MKATKDDLLEITDELLGIEYGELHIHIRGGKIISLSTIKSRLKYPLTNVKQCAISKSIEGSRPNR